MWILIMQDDEIITANCTCMTGLSGSCSHEQKRHRHMKKQKKLLFYDWQHKKICIYNNWNSLLTTEGVRFVNVQHTDTILSIGGMSSPDFFIKKSIRMTF